MCGWRNAGKNSTGVRRKYSWNNFYQSSSSHSAKIKQATFINIDFRFHQQELFEQDLFSYIFHLTFLIRLKVFTVCKSCPVIQDWTHQATFPTERSSRRGCLLKKEISIFRQLHMSAWNPCFLLILFFGVNIVICLFLFINHKERYSVPVSNIGDIMKH